MSLIKNIIDYSISISYLDLSINKIAMSEVSILDKSLLIDSLQEFISDPVLLKETLDAVAKTNSYGFYSRLNVPKEMRGQNIGSLLLEETLNTCFEQNIFLLNTINSYGDLSHEKLIKFYERHGMKVINQDGILVFSQEINTLKNIRKGNLKP